jgi:hypothetical protein
MQRAIRDRMYLIRSVLVQPSAQFGFPMLPDCLRRLGLEDRIGIGSNGNHRPPRDRMSSNFSPGMMRQLTKARAVCGRGQNILFLRWRGERYIPKNVFYPMILCINAQAARSVSARTSVSLP